MSLTLAPRRISRLAVAFFLSAAVLALGTGQAQAAAGDAVFTISNDTGGNQVLVYEQAANGSLTLVDTVATGGMGSGGGLGSQGAVTLSDDGAWLFVVNAGSDSLSVFSVDGTDITLTDTRSTRGAMPISVDVHGNLVYVVNAGSDSITGYHLADGTLRPIHSSQRSLSGSGVGAAQIEFSPDGASLVVTEKATNQITAFRLNASGQAGPGRVSPSAGATPFGFEFDPTGRLVVSEAFGGAPGASAVSTYDLAEDRRASVVDGPVPTTQTAACWIAISADGGDVYTTNTASNTVSRYTLAADGTLTLVDHTVTGTGPIDVDLSDDGATLYVLNAGSDSISVYSVAADGSLTPIQTVTGLPAASTGLAAG